MMKYMKNETRINSFKPLVWISDKSRMQLHGYNA